MRTVSKTVNPGSNPGSPARFIRWFGQSCRGQLRFMDATGKKAGRPSILRRTIAGFRENDLTDWAAALTYYGLLALFPALIALVSIVGLVGDPKETTRTLTEIVTSIGPESAAETFSGPIESIASSRGTAGFAFVLGLAVALWSASSYVGAFIRASNAIYEVEEGRPFWKLRPLQLLVTLAMVLCAAVVSLSLVLTGRSSRPSPSRSASRERSSTPGTSPSGRC